MNILLINDNPVVSRLLALCTRDEHMVLEEVSGVSTIQHGSYDVVFIDDASYEADVLNIGDILTIGKKILLTNEDAANTGFDMSIKKPFLPSQIIDVLESIVEVDDVLDEEELADTQELEEVEKAMEGKHTSGTQVLDAYELEKIKSLLEMDDEIEVNEEELSEEELEMRKVAAIKEQLIADGLEIVDEEEIVDSLSTSDEMIIFSNEKESAKKSKKNKKTKSSKKKNKKMKKKSKKSVKFTEEELERIEDAVQVAIVTLKRKQMKKLLKGKEIEVSIKLEDND